MKKHILIWILTISTCFAFADGKKELKKIIDNVDTKEFSNANKNIDKLQEQGKQYVSQGKFEKALECYKKALAQANKFYGKGSTASAMIYTCMGSLFLKKKEKLKAADSLMNASEIYKNSMGAMLIPHNYYVLRLHAAGIYCSMKKYTVALNVLKELENKIKQLPQKRRAKVYCFLAECYYSESKFIKAIKYCETADKEIINNVNTNDLKTKIYDIWAACLASSGKRKEAVDKFQKCMKYAVKAKRPNSFIGDVFLNTGVNYMLSEDYNNAKKNFAMALKSYQSIKKKLCFGREKPIYT